MAVTFLQSLQANWAVLRALLEDPRLVVPTKIQLVQMGLKRTVGVTL
jgi:hypothetical protein